MASNIFEPPDEAVLAPLLRQFPGRDHQIRSLASLLHTDAAPCRNLVLHGSEATGKSSVTAQLLARLAQHDSTGDSAASNRAPALVYATVDVARCISARHFFEGIIVAVTSALNAWDGTEDSDNLPQRCETLAQLAASLSSIFDQPRIKDNLKHFVLVLDGMDKQRDAPPTLMPALARLCETISFLTCVFVVTTPPAGFLRACPTSYLYFPPYNKSELIEILSKEPPSHTQKITSAAEDAQETTLDPNEATLWTKFCATVHDSLAQSAGRSLPSFRNSCHTLWPRFIAPIVAGTNTPHQFSKLLIAARPFFQDEAFLNPKIISPRVSTSKTSIENGKQPSSRYFESSLTLTISTSQPLVGLTGLLPTTARVLLLSAYIASHNTVRHDLTLFSTHYSGRKRRRAGPNSSRANHRNKQQRLLAIFEAIRTEWIPLAVLPGIDGDIGMGLATLASLRLLIRVGTGDIMDRSGRGIGVNIEEWLVE
ncbi:hypothetical protein TGAM01_v210016 [Trichoderma gamsii]|uniref:Uncharacterized protein n=1 Tax=Trichoderma gamsii TaxID=398673 RepID=A0A2P4ZA58_9HYPO|nr:hypothetical protein TGAM01_v210016 [Trichoderma gamsii]PON21167.1 hypothetical protein TGAM01_v210016 [Trichoderma gamsii]